MLYHRLPVDLLYSSYTTSLMLFESVF